ncbi:MAG: sigma-70 family RNA polymerase sigma factor [Akkermansiaceae bacterium]|nr:sigma-70 family RNA polymerase sigma factor [Akkermansiaceae bacterium]
MGATGTIERLPDTIAMAPEEIWEGEWRRNLFNLALRRLEQKTKAKHYQIFYLNVIKEMSGPAVADQLGVSLAQVYIVKHRLSSTLKKEVRKLEKEMGQATGDAPG